MRPISECSAGGEPWEDTGGRLAARTGVDKQKQQAWPIKRRGAGTAMRRGNTPVANRQP